MIMRRKRRSWRRKEQQSDKRDERQFKKRMISIKTIKTTGTNK